MINDMIHAELDHGNKACKIKSSELPKKGEILNSQYSLLDYATGLQNVETGETVVLDYYEIADYPGEKFIVGDALEYVHDKSKIFSSFDDKARYDKKAYKVVNAIQMYMAAGKKKGELNFSIITGIPSGDKGPKGDPSKEEQLLEKVMLNGGEPIVVSKNSKDKKTMNVKDVRILAQSMGTLFNLHLLDDGTKGDPKWFRSKVVIIDIGFGTFILDLIDKGNIIERFSDMKSISSACHDIAVEMRRDGFKVTKQEVEAALRSNEPFEPNGKLDPKFQERKEKYLSNTADAIYEKIKDYIGDPEDWHEIVITGGGSALIGLLLADKFNGKATVIPSKDAQMFNVNGFHKFKLGLLLAMTAEKVGKQ